MDGRRRLQVGFLLLCLLLLLLSVLTMRHVQAAVANSAAWASILGFLFSVWGLVRPEPATGFRSDADFLSALSNSSTNRWGRELNHRKMGGSPDPIDLDWDLVTGKYFGQSKTTTLVDVEGAAEHTGVASELADRLLRTNGQLAIIGDPGSGKTVQALKLTVELAYRWSQGQPVPVYVNASEWNPTTSFWTWVAGRISTTHADAFSDMQPSEVARRAEELLSNGRIIPIADGIDELADDVQGTALKRIADECSRIPFVITCRTEQFDRAAERLSALGDADVVKLAPVSVKKAVDYLRSSARWRSGEWDEWEGKLGGSAEQVQQVRLAFRRPLVIALARFRYADDRNKPDELFGEAQFLTSQAIEDFFLDYFVDRAIETKFPNFPDKADVRRYLVALARLMEARKHNKTDFPWWTLQQSVRKLGSRSLYVGSIGMIALVMSYLLFRFIQDRDNYLLLTAVTTLACVLIPIASLIAGVPPEEPKRYARRRVGFDSEDFTRAAVIGGVFPGLTSLVVLTVDKQPFVITVAVSVIAFVLFAIAFGLVRLSTPFNPTEPSVTPRSTLEVDTRATWRRGGYLLLIASVGLSLVYFRDESWPRALISGVYCGFLLSIGGMAATPSTWYYATNLYLRLRRKLPLRLMSFLEAAYDAELLRKSGAIYQFRHARLRERLAGSAGGEAASAPALVDEPAGLAH